MNINDLDTSHVEEKPVEIKETDKPISSPVLPEMEANAIGDVLGVYGKEVSQYHDKIDTLLDWAKTQTKDHSVENLKWVIRDLQFKIGSPPLGQKLINWLAEYAYLNKESQSINKRLDQFKNGNN